jgi:hypothetical protein
MMFESCNASETTNAKSGFISHISFARLGRCSANKLANNSCFRISRLQTDANSFAKYTFFDANSPAN